MPETYLYWFRNHFDLSYMYAAVQSHGNEQDEWIPVLSIEKQTEQDIIHLQSSIDVLRSRLKVQGGNLVVLFGNVKKQIPSLARVFKVKGVVTRSQLNGAFNNPEDKWRAQLDDIGKVLASHSIELYFHESPPESHPPKRTSVRYFSFLNAIENPIFLK